MKTNDLRYFLDELLKGRKLDRISHHGHAQIVCDCGTRMESEKQHYVGVETTFLRNPEENSGPSLGRVEDEWKGNGSWRKFHQTWSSAVVGQPLLTLSLFFPAAANALDGVDHILHLFGVGRAAGVDGGVADSPGFVELRLVFG